ncbi:hypothetical protein Tco_0554004 [Tanacetum coccineum]
MDPRQPLGGKQPVPEVHRLKFTLYYDSQIDTTRTCLIHWTQGSSPSKVHYSKTGNVKKFVAERTRHQRQYDRRVNKRQMQTQESKIDTAGLGNDTDACPDNSILATIKSPARSSDHSSCAMPRPILEVGMERMGRKTHGLSVTPTHGSNVDIPHFHECKQTLAIFSMVWKKKIFYKPLSKWIHDDDTENEFGYKDQAELNVKRRLNKRFQASPHNFNRSSSRHLRMTYNVKSWMCIRSLFENISMEKINVVLKSSHLLPIPAVIKANFKNSSDSKSQKLKGIELLFDIAQLEIDTKKAIKASKRKSRFQHQSGGSSEGVGITPEVPDEPTGKSIVSDEGAGISPEVSTNEDEEDDKCIDIENTDDERTESDNDDYALTDAVKIDADKEHEENSEKVEEQKADEELKADEEKQEDD